MRPALSTKEGGRVLGCAGPHDLRFLPSPSLLHPLSMTSRYFESPLKKSQWLHFSLSQVEGFSRVNHGKRPGHCFGRRSFQAASLVRLESRGPAPCKSSGSDVRMFYRMRGMPAMAGPVEPTIPPSFDCIIEKHHQDGIREKPPTPVVRVPCVHGPADEDNKCIFQMNMLGFCICFIFTLGSPCLACQSSPYHESQPGSHTLLSTPVLLGLSRLAIYSLWFPRNRIRYTHVFSTKQARE